MSLTSRSLSQETIEDIDKDKDGLIDLKEYIGEEPLLPPGVCRHFLL